VRTYRTYQDGVAVVVILSGQAHMLRIIGHVEDHVCQLGALTNRPIKKSYALRCRHARRIDYNVLDADIEIDRSALVGVFAIDDVIARKARAGFERGWIKSITYNDSAHIELETLVQQVRSSRNIYHGRLTGGSHGIVGPVVWGVGRSGCHALVMLLDQKGSLLPLMAL
jgi:hypothetical protein